MFFKNKNQNEPSLENIVSSEAEKVEEDVGNKSQEKDTGYGGNIFKELSGELDFGESTDTHEKEEEVKDLTYYLRIAYKIIVPVNICFFGILILFFIYFKIQNNPIFYSKSYLDPLCFVFLSDKMKNTGDYCSSVAALSQDYNAKTEKLKNDIVSSLSLLTEDIYAIDNFIYSKEVTFLMDAKVNKLNTINIVNDFDKMKNDFSGGDKKMIVCDSLTISKDYIDVTCNAYSSSWESTRFVGGGIVGTTGDRNSSVIEGTSITVASSFLNFIEKNPNYNFKIIDKQKTFSSETVIGEGPYVRKTTFNVKLKYNNILNNLSI